MKDSFNRNINYLRISVTDLCNLRCKYCMPINGICKKTHDDMLSFDEIELIAKEFVNLGVDKIRITGGEPLVRNGILDLVEKVGKIKGLKDFAMTTNGILLKKYAKELKLRGLNRVNISIDTLDESKYSHITRGGDLRKVLDGIEEAIKVGLYPIKLNVVLIGGFNDDEIENFVNLTKEADIDVRFIELMPIGEASDWNIDKFISNSTVLEKVKSLIKIESTDKSSPANYYKLPNGKGKIGLINPITCKFCDNCNRVRVTSEGKLKLCLHSNDEIDLRPHINNEDFGKLISDIVKEKPEYHKLEDGEYLHKNMVQIGG